MPRETLHICSHCNEAFAFEYIYSHAIHVKTHTEEKPHYYSHFNKSSTQKSHPPTHEKKKAGDITYRENFCNKAFAYKSTLVIHENIPTGDKPYGKPQ